MKKPRIPTCISKVIKVYGRRTILQKARRQLRLSIIDALELRVDGDDMKEDLSDVMA